MDRKHEIPEACSQRFFMLGISLSMLLFILYANAGFSQSKISTSKPWTFWFWMGSAVDKEEIKLELGEFSRSGIGGVHIVPVYGVKGFENQFLPFLSENWMEMVRFTIEEANHLNLGVDISLGTGWPFGGNWINNRFVAKKLTIKEYKIDVEDIISIDPDTLINNNRFLELIGIVASNGKGEQFNLSPRIPEKIIHQHVDPGTWKLSCIGITNTNQKVKRAAPGGEGLVIDYFDERAMEKYLVHFDSIFAETKFKIKPRAWFHDSYEAYQANWSFRFPGRFKEMQGYEFTEALPVLMDTSDKVRPLIVHDFRETLADLLYNEFASTWTGWCRESGSETRYQAHGSPGNLLDLYGISDIPETESFGCSNFPIPKLGCDPDYEEKTFGRPSPLMMKFASSPAHILNKKLVSSETATWLADHFRESLSMVKPQVDELFIAGINHIFYQGITYSPKNETYPGWLFYASTNFGRSSHFWDEFPLLNSYIEECQNLLQNSSPDNDILLYFPIDDLWTKYPGDLLLLLDVHHYSEWFGKSSFGKTSKLLWDNGFAFDYISDKQLKQLKISSSGKLSQNSNSSYSVIIIPEVDFINKNTLKLLDSLAQNGIKIIFANKLPEQFSGYLSQKENKSELISLKNKLKAKTIISSDLVKELKSINIRQEEIKLKGLDFIRKRNNNGTVYFITNLSNQFYEGNISLSVKSEYIEIFDPLNLKKGFIQNPDPFFLQLPPGKSCFIKTYMTKPDSSSWNSTINSDTLILNDPWEVSFISGNNLGLKSKYSVVKLNSWTEWGDDSLKSFCGKAKYISGFTINNFNKSNTYRLVFDDIRETANISINGIPCGTIWSLPYSLEIPGNVLKKKNTIEIIVQNLSANRMRKIDQDKIPWKKFYDINFVDIKYQPFDASRWALVPSGIIGKVCLITCLGRNNIPIH
ncbi:MAG: glycosyl hydrolase [Bacteroidales bacterium]|jgi:hypothetical protein